MKKWTTRVLLFAIGFSGASHAYADDAKPTYKVTNTFQIGGEGGWDYSIVDPATHLLYTSRGNHTQVIDTTTGKVVADMPKCGAHGIALVPDLNKGFTSDGRANTVTAFDLKTHAVLYTVPTGQNPDCIIYDPSSKKIFAFDGRSNDVTVIDPAAPAAAAVSAHIPLDGKPEFAVADGTGHVYDCLENKSEIVDIDTRSMTVVNTWKLDGAESPSGLAIDIEHHHLFAGCEGKMAVVDTSTGKTIATPAIGAGVDACGFDPKTGEAFASCGDGTLTVIRETAPGKIEPVQTVQTARGARTMALDVDTDTIYLATADFEPRKEGERRPKMKADTFKILVVTQAK
jgi:DNA-binding beta-propeller fold protein YncE